MKIVFTGGHHNSALELAKHLRTDLNAEIVWFGHTHTSLTDKNLSAEYNEVTMEGIRFIDIKAGKLYKTTNIIHILRVPYGFLQAFYFLLKERPTLIVSFGGYLAVPIVIAGFLLGIPSVTHEQTTVVGMANSVISRFAKKIFITWQSSEQYFPKEKVVVSGLPLRDELFQHDDSLFVFQNDLPTVYVTAGKQGSHVINEAIKPILQDLLTFCNVIHQCGSHSEFDDFSTFKEIQEQLPDALKDRYVLQKYIYLDEIGSAFSVADVLVSRAGAHITYEIAALGKPSILIPIPWVSHNEQMRNAQVLEKQGAAVILEQHLLSGDTLRGTIQDFLSHLEQYQKRAQEMRNTIRFDATECMEREIGNMLQENVKAL